MPKTGLKTFVCSFSVSLLAIFTVNGVYWHETNASDTDILIPSQNITLFLNRQSDNPSTRPVPVKKIALTVLPEMRQTAGNEVPPPSKEPEIIMADTSDVLEIPLEFGLELVKPATDVSQSSKIAADYDRLMSHPPALAEVSIPQPRDDRKTDKAISDNAKKDAPKRESQVKTAPPLKTPHSEVAAAVAPTVEQPKAYQTVQAEIRSFIPAPNSAEGVRPIQDDEARLPSPKAVDKPAAEKIVEAETDQGGAIPLQRVRDVWAGRSENIRIADRGTPNQVALADENIPIKSMANNLKPVEPEAKLPQPDKEQWEKMADKVNSDSPWAVAKSAGKNRNQLLAQEKFSQAENRQVSDALNATQSDEKGIKVAAETVKNLLIPIPEDILNDENLTPQLVSSKKPEDIRKEIEVEENLRETVRPDTVQTLKRADEPLAGNQASNSTLTAALAPGDNAAQRENEKKKNILNSLSSIFSSATNVKEKSKKNRDEGVFDNFRRKIAGRNRVKIMPTEMRLSFQPNRAEISGQTLRWIQAFAAKAAEDDGTMIEIRIDGTSATELQQKRLNLLHNILTNKGVEYSKINTVFTQREPNSFIIRTLRLSNINTGSHNGNVNRATQGYYLQW